MPKKSSQTWGVEVMMTDGDGKHIIGRDGKSLKTKAILRLVGSKGLNKSFKNEVMTQRVFMQNAGDSNVRLAA
ncbi:hypothetical protein PAXRUDRAFT_18571 [Paxillus rubicundulus Ve08.2h10]|uniref:Uncharacterized protein n=1 Tax=Paxillus rubicundulus Ve08.2h10 TaxID=930991 RepID=A0A0D0DEI5_9AGAM|nr:hypothetical protein PAXRUDRAFT_18571 [Paxillus rubicundulus Ve08.2h10]